MLRYVLGLLLSTSQLALGSSFQDKQVILVPSPEVQNAHTRHFVDKEILTALKTHSDPVAVLVALQPEIAATLAEPRLLHIFGDQKPEWMTEGDKLRLHRRGKKFMDITDHQDFYAQQVDTLSGKANLPDLKHQPLIKPLFSHVSTQRMHDIVKHMTGYYNRHYGSTYGALSAEWLHDHIAKIIDNSPFGTHISLEYFTHPFPQSSIIARFEPKVRNFSQPLTILGAHQDSANYLFPLLPALGADDDFSGLYTPKNGAVEFHWYAAEEGGNLGSQAIARYKKEQEATIGAMMSFDMTAFIARNATESIGFIKTQADAALMNWLVKLSTEYVSIPAEIYELPVNAGSDYMSYTKFNYPAALASEGNPLAHGGFPGDLDPYLHGVNDTIDIDDDTGFFSLDHMARFSELAIAFAVEQGGWDNPWR